MAEDEIASRQVGLLDLSVELSSPEIYSGEEFIVYFKIKNPFDKPIWILEVSVNVPSKMYWNKDPRPQIGLLQQAISGAKDTTVSMARSIIPLGSVTEFTSQITNQFRKTEIDVLLNNVKKQRMRMAELRQELEKIEDKNSDVYEQKQREILRQSEAAVVDEQKVFALLGYDIILIRDESVISYADISSERPALIRIEGNANLQQLVTQPHTVDERVELTGTLPRGAALHPNSRDSWSIRLGTRNSLFFVPAQYRLQFNVVYSFNSFERSKSLKELQEIKHEMLPGDISQAINVRASIWTLMIGAVIGGLLGALARELQTGLDTSKPLEIGLRMGLASILSLAAVIFAARKAETQTFISVEDFWGGALIGFLIGYSGSTAFQDFTKISQPASTSLPIPTPTPQGT